MTRAPDNAVAHGLHQQLRSQTRLMNSLHDAIVNSRPSLLNHDLVAFEVHSDHQAALCRELQFLQENIRQSPASGGAAADPATIELLKQAEAARVRLRTANLVQASLLRRTRRSTNVFMNILANAAPLYRPPGSARTAEAEE